MRAKEFQVVAGLAVVLLLMMGAAACGFRSSAKKAENLVLIVVDTLRQDRLGAYGYPRPVSPVLDRLAETGVRADGLAPSSWTRPSMATLFTGLNPLSHQVAASTDLIPPTVPTLAEILSRRGYSTLGVSTNGHVSQAWGFARGFDEFLPTWKLGYGQFATSAQVNELLLPRLDRLRPPFFLFVHYLDPHQPYDPPTAFDGGPLPPEIAAFAPLREGEAYPNWGSVLPELVRAASDLYDGEVRANDASIGRLLERLRELGLDRRTMVLVTSDHGEEFFEHGRSGHGKALFSESTAVPMIFNAEGIVCAGGHAGRIGLEDVLPTVLAMLGIRDKSVSADRIDGVDQSAALRCGGDVKQRPRLLYLEGNPDAGLALVHGNDKLLLGLEPYRKNFFDLSLDPGEHHDRLPSAEANDAAEAIATRLAETYNNLMLRAHRRHTTTADQELTEQLAALGYGGVRNPIAAVRTFPRRIRPADAVAGGLRGWENVSAFEPCIDVLQDPAGQLLEGWWRPAPQEAGRWSAGRGTFALPAPSAGRGTLELRGASFRPDRARLELWPVVGSGIWEGEVEPGAVSLSMSVENLPPAGVALFRFEVSPEFQPSRFGSPDQRTLGVFITSICLSSSQ